MPALAALLRSTGFYTFRSPAQGGARRFRLRISKETSARLAVAAEDHADPRRWV